MVAILYEFILLYTSRVIFCEIYYCLSVYIRCRNYSLLFMLKIKVFQGTFKNFRLRRIVTVSTVDFSLIELSRVLVVGVF